ncbi:MAG: hypothetical protein HY454_02750, partial [Parcubacteria group bacterium]|nr:hypothetical protein [Parcubacteria group bacterium]
ILAVVIFLLILLVGVVWWWATRVSANEFVGKVQKVEGSQLTLEGVYLVKDRPDLMNPSNSKTVMVAITGDTKILKEALHLPTLDEVQKTGGRYDPSKLKRDVVVGAVGDFKIGETSVTVNAGKNIYGKKSFTALEVRYIEPVYPD